MLISSGKAGRTTKGAIITMFITNILLDGAEELEDKIRKENRKIVMRIFLETLSDVIYGLPVLSLKKKPLRVWG